MDQTMVVAGVGHVVHTGFMVDHARNRPMQIL